MFCLGSSVAVLLDSGRAVRPRGAAMLFDPTGSAWPTTSILIIPFAREQKEPDRKVKGLARRWYGKEYDFYVGKVVLPPRITREWEVLGNAQRIDFTRGGYEHPGPMKHVFGQMAAPGVAALLPAVGGLSFEKDRPVLRKFGQAYRVDHRNPFKISAQGLLIP